MKAIHQLCALFMRNQAEIHSLTQSIGFIVTQIDIQLAITVTNE